jgi:hypothetical protein
MGWNVPFLEVTPIKRWVALLSVVVFALAGVSAAPASGIALRSSSFASLDLADHGNEPITLPFVTQAGSVAVPVRSLSDPARGVPPADDTLREPIRSLSRWTVSTLMPVGQGVDNPVPGHPGAIGCARTPTGPPPSII